MKYLYNLVLFLSLAFTCCEPVTTDDNPNDNSQDYSVVHQSVDNSNTTNQNPIHWEVTDIYPIEIVIIPLNAQGENLLDSRVTDNLLDTDSFYAVFRGQFFFLNRGGEVPTKDYLPVFKGLYSLHFDNNLWELRFGELDGTEYYDNEDLIMYWPNGRIDTITIYNKLEWNDDEQEIVVERKYFLNGEIAQNASFTIVLD